jgi:hypothetical protein
MPDGELDLADPAFSRCQFVLMLPRPGTWLFSNEGAIIMQRSIPALVCVVLLSNSMSFVPADPPPNPADELPTGQWIIEFSNGVVETCEIRKDGTASVSEPKRSSDGRASIRNGAIVIVFDDDRVERWTRIGQRMVVEHWFPACQFPRGNAVRGIGEHPR